MNARKWMAAAAGGQVTTDKLMADLGVLATDVEQLLKATAGQTGQQVAQVRAKAEESLSAMRVRVAELQQLAQAKTRAVGQATDDFAHANPWQVVAIGAVAGLALGLALARGGDSHL